MAPGRQVDGGTGRRGRYPAGGRVQSKGKGVRVSQLYKLGRTQPTLDFVDVDVFGDARVFVDPRALRLLPSTWGDECVSLVQDFFSTVLRAIRAGRDAQAQALLRVLREPNETHLGLSKGRSRGRALGSESARDLWSALRKSDAVSSGLLLVPKVIVRTKMDYDVEEYYRDYLLEHLKGVELRANSELVRLLRDGRSRVTKKDLSTKYGRGKATIVRETRNHPEVLQRYRHDKRQHYRPPLDHEGIARSEGTPLPEWDELLRTLRGVPSGPDSFGRYEGAIEALLSALFYPSLANPQMQRKIHDGRKRIDLVYTNTATAGFFDWVGRNYAAPHVFVECKNYEGEPANPELDQLSGRFSPSRGQFGILTCRKIRNKSLFLRRCRDTAADGRGFIVALDDDDLAVLVDELKEQPSRARYDLLMERFQGLIF